VYLEAMGCRLNAAEAETLARQFSGAGHQVVQDPTLAEIIVVNSCAVTSQAVRKAERGLRALHRANPEAGLAVTGCWATADQAGVGTIEGVQWVVPNADKATTVSRVLSRELQAAPGASQTVLAPWAPGRWGHTRAFLGVQDGCDHACTYCVTRILRGPGRSLSLDEALTAARARVQAGAREIVLTGTSLGAYGRDLGLCDGLAQLVSAILADTDVPRLRLSSIEPWDVSAALLDLWRDRRVCRQLHIPLQSGSDAVLRLMGRPIKVGAFVGLVDRARAISPEIAITTDLIAGFPGETAEDFAETMRVVREVRFARLHVFPYSERPGTAALRLPNPVPRAERRARAQEVRALGETLAADYRGRFIGRVLPVLWEPRNRAGAWAGLTDNYLEVQTRDERMLYNRVTPTRLVGEREGMLVGEVLGG